MSRRARARAGAMFAKRFHLEMPPDGDEADDHEADDAASFELDREAEQPPAMEPAR